MSNKTTVRENETSLKVIESCSCTITFHDKSFPLVYCSLSFIVTISHIIELQSTPTKEKALLTKTVVLGEAKLWWKALRI